MDTNLFSLFGSEESDDQNLPKKQTPKKKNSKTSKQSVVDLFAFDTEEQPIEETVNSEPITLETTENPPLLTPESSVIIESELLNQVEIKNTLESVSVPEENAILIKTNHIDDAIPELAEEIKEEAEEEIAEEVEVVDYANHSENQIEQLPEMLLESSDIPEFQHKETEQTTAENSISVVDEKIATFDISPIESTDITEKEPSLDEYLARMEMQHADKEDDILEQQYIQEVIVSDYSMFMEPTSLATVQEPIVSTAETDNQEFSLPEWELTKKYYSIGEVAKLFDVNTSHIRFWSKEFSFRLRTTKKGDRMYTPEDIQRLRLIHELVKVKKHTIKGAKEILNTKSQKVSQTVDLKDNLKDLRNMLLGIQKKL